MDQTCYYRGVEHSQQALAGRAPAAAPDGASLGPKPATSCGRSAIVHHVVDAFVERRQASAAAAGEPWDCRSGCAHCCKHPVGIGFDEAQALVVAVQSLAPPRRRALLERLQAAATTSRARSWEQLAELACPLLADDRCELYEARPVPCRAFGSTSSDACALPERHAGVPFDRDAFGFGLGASQTLAGELGHRELRSALAAMLAAPTGQAAQRRAFGEARHAGD